MTRAIDITSKNNLKVINYWLSLCLLNYNWWSKRFNRFYLIVRRRKSNSDNSDKELCQLIWNHFEYHKNHLKYKKKETILITTTILKITLKTMDYHCSTSCYWERRLSNCRRKNQKKSHWSKGTYKSKIQNHWSKEIYKSKIQNTSKWLIWSLCLKRIICRMEKWSQKMMTFSVLVVIEGSISTNLKSLSMLIYVFIPFVKSVCWAI